MHPFSQHTLSRGSFEGGGRGDSGTAALLYREQARASNDCGGRVHQAFLQHSGSDYRLSVSNSTDPGRMTWTRSGSRARGRGPIFDVSQEVRQGAGGEGWGAACRRQSPLPSRTPPQGRRQLVLLPLSSLPCLGPGLRQSLCAAPTSLFQTRVPKVAPWPAFHGVLGLLTCPLVGGVGGRDCGGT